MKKKRLNDDDDVGFWPDMTKLENKINAIVDMLKEHKDTESQRYDVSLRVMEEKILGLESVQREKDTELHKRQQVIDKLKKENDLLTKRVNLLSKSINKNNIKIYQYLSET